MLPHNNPHALVVETYKDMPQALMHENTHLVFCEGEKSIPKIQSLLNRLAKSDKAFYIVVHKQFDDYMYFCGVSLFHKTDYLSASEMLKALSLLLKECDPTFTQTEVDILKLWLFNEVMQNLKLLETSFSAAPIFSYITNHNEQSLDFTQSWHQDNNPYALISVYEGDGTLFLPYNEDSELVKFQICSVIKNCKPYHYQLPSRGKSMHKGFNLIQGKSPFHTSPCTPHRLIGIAATDEK